MCKLIKEFKKNDIEWCIVKDIKAEKMFSATEWNKIFPDLYTYAEINVFLSKGYGQYLIAYNLISMEPFAFVFLYLEDKKQRKVVFHGGGWKKGNTLLHYTAFVYLLERLFKKKYKIRTSCLVSNERAFRFLHSVGFVNYYTTTNYRYLWLPQKRFQNTKIYKRVNNSYFFMDKDVRKTVKDSPEIGKLRYETYKGVISKCDSAIKEGFYLEAITLMESMIFDRLTSIINETQEKQVKSETFATLIKRSEKIEFLLPVIDPLNKWRKQRNASLHEMAKSLEPTFSEKYNATKDIAKEGKKLFRDLDKIISDYRKSNKK